MIMSDKRIAIVMVVTQRFIPGARVTLSTFLRHNRWFRGDIIIIHGQHIDISELSDLWPTMYGMRPGSDFLSALHDMNYSNKWAHYAKGEILRVTGYDFLILMDADLLFRACIRKALHFHNAIAAPPDRAQLTKQFRSKEDYSLLSADCREKPLAYTFCSGFMIMDGQLSGSQMHTQYLNLMKFIGRTGHPEGYADQAVFNLLFQDNVMPLDQSYNYMVASADQMNLSMKEAKLIHFNTLGKPWIPSESNFEKGSGSEMDTAYQWWREAWREVANLHE